jgi:hypothetical protein
MKKLAAIISNIQLALNKANEGFQYVQKAFKFVTWLGALLQTAADTFKDTFKDDIEPEGSKEVEIIELVKKKKQEKNDEKK